MQKNCFCNQFKHLFDMIQYAYHLLNCIYIQLWIAPYSISICLFVFWFKQNNRPFYKPIGRHKCHTSSIYIACATHSDMELIAVFAQRYVECAQVTSWVVIINEYWKFASPFWQTNHLIPAHMYLKKKKKKLATKGLMRQRNCFYRKVLFFQFWLSI